MSKASELIESVINEVKVDHGKAARAKSIIRGADVMTPDGKGTVTDMDWRTDTALVDVKGKVKWYKVKKLKKI